MTLHTVSPGAWGEAHQQVMTISGDLVHRCPFRDEEDRGAVTITWDVDGATLELHALADYLRTFTNQLVSHEDLTGRIHTDITRTGLRGVTVTTTWRTAGLDVTVTR